LARDGFMPRQLSHLGDKLVFNNGVLALGFLSALLIIVKNGSVDALIPLYAIGVFLAFTLSQSGMVRHWFKAKTKGWAVKAIINGCGAVATFLVLIDIAAEKFVDGAWVIILLVIVLVICFKKVCAHYLDVSEQLRISPNQPIAVAPKENIVLVFVQGINNGTLQTLNYALSLSKECIAVHVEIDAAQTAAFKEQWFRIFPNVYLEVLNSPFRSLLEPIMVFIDQTRDSHLNANITVIIGEFVATKWWHSFLHGHTGLVLKLAMLSKRNVVVTNVRYYLQKRPEVFPKNHVG
jgi:hypothetical protein